MSLRSRVLLGMAVVALVLIGAAAAIARTTEHYLVDRVDDQLAATPGIGPGGPQRRGPEPFANLSSVYVGRLTVEGSVETLREPYRPSGDTALPAISVDRARAAIADGKPFTVGTEPASGTRYRVRAIGDDGLLVALPLSDVDAAVSRLIGLEALATVVVVAILALVAFWVIRLGVRPVKRMTETATAIAGGDLSHRVPDVQPGTEAGELGVALNAMLGRIEEAFAERTASEERLRRFVGDASHELRTPVTTIRGYAELYRRGGLTEEEQLRQAMGRTEDEAIRMGRIIEDLLLLARLDQGRPLDQAPVDLGTIAEHAAQDAQAVQPDRPVDCAVHGAATVVGDDGRLRQVVGNLVGNALVHTPPGTPVHVVVDRDGQDVVLEVRDEGPGMEPDVAAHAFERFYRADPSRSRHQGGSGLGLAIVQAIVEAHGGQVGLESAPGVGTAVRVRLPGHDAGSPTL